MGFMDDKPKREKKESNVFLEVSDVPKRVRPLAKSPTSRWLHAVPSVEQLSPKTGKMENLRYFFTVVCTSIGRSGTGCDPCTMKDPLWHLLSAYNQRNSKGMVVHFPKRQQFELPVWDYDLNDVRILRGKQVFENMNAWWDTRKSDSDRDLSKLDWIISTKGEGERKKWTSQPDLSPEFDQNDADVQDKLAQCMIRMAEMMKPMSREEFTKRIYGVSGLDQSSTEEVKDAPQAKVAAPAGSPPFESPYSKVPPFVQDQAAQAPAPAPFVQAPKPADPPAPAKAKAKPSAELSMWIAKQPEFSGANLASTLLPALKAKLGSVDYHSLNETQLADLKSHLEGVLAQLRK